MLRSAFSARDQGRLRQYVSIYQSKFRLNPAETITANAMVYNITSGRGSGARQAASSIMQSFKKSGGNVDGEALRAVGALVFRQVNGEMERYEKVALKGGTVEALLASIQKKVAAYQKVDEAYGQVLATKDAYWGVAALYQLGFGYEQFALALENPPSIKGASQEDVVKQLAGDAASARTEAKKYYGSALESVQKYMVYNQWAAKALSGMARLSGKGVTFDDLVITPDFLGAEVPTSVSASVKQGAGS